MHGLLTSALFGIVAVVAMAYGSAFERPSASTLAGVFTVTLLFAGVVTMPRTMLLEDEQGTLDLLRLIAAPKDIYWGKLLYGILQMVFMCFFLGILFLILGRLEVRNPLLFVGGLISEGVTIAGCLAMTGALATGAQNRWLLAGVLGLPLLLPQATMSHGVLQEAFGGGRVGTGASSLLGLALYALAVVLIGPVIGEFLWRLEETKPGNP